MRQPIQFGSGGSLYKCTLSNYVCTREGPIPRKPDGFADSGPEDSTINPSENGGDPSDGLAYQPPASQDGDEGEYGPGEHSCAPRKEPLPADRARGERALHFGVGSQLPGERPPANPEVCASFDGKWEAFIQNFNVYVKPVGKEPGLPLSFDGSEGNYYTLRTLAWSPGRKNWRPIIRALATIEK